ncbi:hypothetical protein [Alkalimarinus alittae]|uniref:Transposase n=1 Tax=Alkalimarinus alittae TaxID=2961619 RepID=A0ABY6MX61_9ALTE|nr:hypothetical protein [Alkalimarinus alittae]UZE94390.1 hypothetical protein NKI27_09805 [Alkalimarinus alittae]
MPDFDIIDPINSSAGNTVNSLLSENEAQTLQAKNACLKNKVVQLEERNQQLKHGEKYGKFASTKRIS